jgi:hypothetical protein
MLNRASTRRLASSAECPKAPHTSLAITWKA